MAPPIPGLGLPNVRAFRDIADVETMIAAAKSDRRAVVIGGGLLGLEAAWGLKRRGMSVALVHLMPTLMERQLDVAAGELLYRDLDARGIAFFTNSQTEEIVGTNRAEAVLLADGRQVPADFVVLILVDLHLTAGWSASAAFCQLPNNGADRYTRHRCQNEPQRHRHLQVVTSAIIQRFLRLSTLSIRPHRFDEGELSRFTRLSQAAPGVRGAALQFRVAGQGDGTGECIKYGHRSTYPRHVCRARRQLLVARSTQPETNHLAAPAVRSTALTWALTSVFHTAADPSKPGFSLLGCIL